MKNVALLLLTLVPSLALADGITFACKVPGTNTVGIEIAKYIYSATPQVTITDAGVASKLGVPVNFTRPIMMQKQGYFGNFQSDAYESFLTDGPETNGLLFAKEGDPSNSSFGYRIYSASQSSVRKDMYSPETLYANLTNGLNYFFHAADCTGTFY